MAVEASRSGAATRGFVRRAGRPSDSLDVTLDLLVAHVRVVAEGALAADVRIAIDAMGFQAGPARAGCPTVHLRRVADVPPGTPPTADLRLQAHAHARGYSVPGGWLLWTPAGRSSVTPHESHAELSAAATTSEVAWHLVVAVQVLVRAHGAYALHAAALGAGAAGVLLVGPSDAGKSTLAYTLVREGWGFVSDDSVLLREEAPGGAVEAVVFRRRFGLDDDGRFPEVVPHAVPQPVEEAKWSVDVASMHAGQARTSVVPRLIVVPQIADAAESRLTPLAPAEAFACVLAQVGTRRLTDAHTAAHHALLGRLLAQAPAVRLAAGRDVFDVPTRVAGLLARALPTWP